MTERNGYEPPPLTAKQVEERSWRADRHALAVAQARDQHEALLADEPEWVDVARGLGLAAGLFSGLILFPCIVMAIAAGDLPTPWPVRVAAALVGAVGVASLFAIGISRALHGSDTDWS